MFASSKESHSRPSGGRKHGVIVSKRLIWELFLLTAGIVYVVVALCDGVESLAFILVFVPLVAQELVHTRRERH